MAAARMALMAAGGGDLGFQVALAHAVVGSKPRGQLLLGGQQPLQGAGGQGGVASIATTTMLGWPGTAKPRAASRRRISLMARVGAGAER
jgi:hypothetical protein